jgi:CHASE3 domain sensor protein
VNDERDARIVQLLEELRDLHRQHLDLYREALRNQAEFVQVQRELQQSAAKRLKMIPTLIVVVLGFVIVILVLLGRVIWRWL